MTDKHKLARPELTEIILTMVKNERVRQDVKYGIQSHSHSYWQLFLNKKLGDFSNTKIKHESEEEQLKALVQVAAVLVAWAEDQYDHIEQANTSQNDDHSNNEPLLSTQDKTRKNGTS